MDYGPIKLLLQLKDNLDCPEQGLLWEYWGRNGWREVNLVDETRSFSKTGIVTLIGCKDFASRRMFGEEKYWLRISDVNNSYGAKARPAALPVLEGIFMNAVRIVGADRSNTEYFQMEIYQENTRFELPDQRIMEAEVYVNEVDASAGPSAGRSWSRAACGLCTGTRESCGRPGLSGTGWRISLIPAKGTGIMCWSPTRAISSLETAAAAGFPPRR